MHGERIFFLLQNWQLGYRAEDRRYASHCNNQETHGSRFVVSEGDTSAPSYYLRGELQELNITSLGQHFQRNFSELDMAPFKSQTFCEQSVISVSPWTFLMAGGLLLGLPQLDRM